MLRIYDLLDGTPVAVFVAAMMGATVATVIVVAAVPVVVGVLGTPDVIMTVAVAIKC